ncbi:Luc7-like protein 3 [Bonamia ostreae]|uniref:Luc7-like protein 3 n=1 Tax=Bonamia ostreae TaxID=126728 RepID=A0ABV2AQR6_9EUKA
MEAQRALLDQLMGADRNLAPEDGKKMRHRWKKRGVCPYFICGFCPYELFVNTKAAIGNCHLAHDYTMQKAFSDEPIEAKKSYLKRFCKFLTSVMDELDERYFCFKRRKKSVV